MPVLISSIVLEALDLSLNNMTQQIIQLAGNHGYTLEFHKPDNKLLRFRLDREIRIDVWYTTFTVAVLRNGNTKYKKDCSLDQLEKIFIDPSIVNK